LAIITRLVFLLLNTMSYEFTFHSSFILHHWLFTFQRLTDKQLEKIRQQLTQQKDDDAGESKILCKSCQHPITSHHHKIEINGNHQHICHNPADFVFEIGCFALANGCINHGVATLENTWFPGFAWRYAICANCHTHLGWFYQSNHDNFYGLILNQLIEKEV
jgi:hypothetical protein